MKNFPVACITGNHSKTYNYLFEKKTGGVKNPASEDQNDYLLKCLYILISL